MPTSNQARASTPRSETPAPRHAAPALDTHGLPTAEQIAGWEAHNRRHILAIRCMSAGDGHLEATQRNGSFGALRFAEMRVSAHVVERREAEIAEDPRQVAIIILLLEGEAMLGQEGRWVSLRAGDLAALRSDRPYICAYPRGMRQMVLTLPLEDFARLRERPLERLEHVPASDLGGGALRWLTSCGEAWLAGEIDDAAGRQAHDHGLGMVAELFRQAPSRRESRHGAHYLAAQAWIADHLSDPRLTPADVAQALSISLHHLNRVFAAEGTTLRRSLEERRLHLALQLLQDPAKAHLSLCEIAYDCGFSEQSVFSRQFRRAFGMTPSAARKAG